MTKLFSLQELLGEGEGWLMQNEALLQYIALGVILGGVFLLFKGGVKAWLVTMVALGISLAMYKTME